MDKCLTCGRELNNPADMPYSADCGGDCRQCMAVLGDPDERDAIATWEREHG